jgi:hypothetical protein
LDSVAKGEMAEATIDAFISRRDERRRTTEGERLEEELWMPSERAYFEQLEEQKRLERLEYHEGQARRLSNTLEALVAHHLAEAARYRNGHHEEETAGA